MKFLFIKFLFIKNSFLFLHIKPFFRLVSSFYHKHGNLEKYQLFREKSLSLLFIRYKLYQLINCGALISAPNCNTVPLALSLRSTQKT